MLRIPHDDLESSEGFLLLTYQGEPFTGMAFEDSENGELMAEVEYVNGQRHGLKREWFPGGRLKKEVELKFGAAHGVKREWHERGALKTESEYELGICLHRKRWDEKGTLLEEMRLDERSPQFAMLQQLRVSTIGRLVKT